MSYKRFTRDIGISLASQIVSAVSGIITLPIITKLLGAQEYGVWTQLFVTLLFLSTIALLGLPYTVVRFLAGEKDASQIQDGIWSTSTLVLVISSALALLLIIFSGPVSRLLGCAQILIILLAVLIIFDYVNQVFYNIFRAFQYNIRVCLFSTIQELSKTGLIILAVGLHLGLAGALAGVLMARIILFFIMGGLIVKEFGFSMPRFLKTREYLVFGIPTIPDNFSNWIIQSSDRYLIGLFLGTIFVGYYSSAYVIGTFVISAWVGPFGFLLPAILSKFYDEQNTQAVKMYLRYSLKYFLFLAIPSAFGLLVLSKPILTLLTTAQFAEAAHWVMPVVAFSMIPMGANAIIAQIIGLLKKTKVAAAIAMVAAALNLTLNLIFIPWLGIMGAALTTFIAFFFLFAATWGYAFRHFTFNIDWQSILKSLVASLAMCLVVLQFNPLGLWQTLSIATIGAITYAFTIIILKGLSAQEIQLFKQLLKNA